MGNAGPSVGLEPIQGHVDLVLSNGQNRKGKYAILIRCGGEFDCRLRIGDDHCCSGNDRAGLVLYDARDLPSDFRACGGNKNQHQNEQEQKLLSCTMHDFLP